MNLTPEEKAVGDENFNRALQAYDGSDAADAVNRREFLKSTLGAGGALAAGAGAAYFGYGASLGDPVRIGVIGTGDEGNILIGAINPEYVDVVAICDIRPSSIHRAFHGDWSNDNIHKLRRGLMEVYDYKTESAAREHVAVYERYQDLLADPNIEAVIIALPLHLHHPVSMEAMAAGKHVLTEKLMAHSVMQCKEMCRAAAESNLYLATGHQRHYSILYDNAVQLLRWGVLGQLHHIRAQWHRGNLPGADSWCPPLPGGEMAVLDKNGNPQTRENFDKLQGDLNYRVKKLAEAEEQAKEGKSVGAEIERLERQIALYEQLVADKNVNAAEFGYEEITRPDGSKRSALEELIRWRLWNRTGGGLMAELGSHQLDAASIFVSAMREDGKKAHPINVHAVGGRHIFPNDRDAEDHVYCMFEFPGPHYGPDFKPGYLDRINSLPDPTDGILGYNDNHERKIVVTYSSINGNGYGGYGEVVMGTNGTLMLLNETEKVLFKDSDTSSYISVSESDSGSAVLDTTSSGAQAPVAAAATAGPPSRGYKEEIEHWAWCIRNQAPENQPRCKPEVALGDAVIALTAKLAIRRSREGKGGYVQYNEDWFKVDSDATPEAELA